MSDEIEKTEQDSVAETAADRGCCVRGDSLRRGEAEAGPQAARREAEGCR